MVARVMSVTLRSLGAPGTSVRRREIKLNVKEQHHKLKLRKKQNQINSVRSEDEHLNVSRVKDDKKRKQTYQGH